MAKILGGPAVRRVSKDEINIWLVLDNDATVEARAYGTSNDSILATATEQSTGSVQLGANLFFYLLQLVPEKGAELPLDTKIYYDIDIDGSNLEAMGATKGTKPITYSGEKLPSIVIPSKHNRILQASCRKPHAKQSSHLSQHDQLTHGDRLLKDAINDLEGRPSMLLLTGDQIYADDVAAPLLAGIIPKARELMGEDEWIPDDRGEGNGFIPANLKLCNRSKKLTSTVGFTSSHGDNHLISFGEFIAMYLAVWGGIDIEMPDWMSVHKNIAFRMENSHGNKGMKKRYKTNRTAYEQEKARVQQFLKSSWKVRRLMANIPTYMMFDDHEVTDDWNLRKDTAKNLATTPTGKRLCTNGLAAYWACQGWGNDPSMFGQAFKDSLSRFYAKLNYNAAEDAEKKLLKQYWGYLVPGYPALISLDTRTDRHFGSGSGPGLMSKRAFKWLEDVLKELKRTYKGEGDAQTLLILSPSPYYGYKPIERIQERLVERYRGLDKVVDAEYWSADPPTKAKFDDLITKYQFTKDTLFLSGDVHYSYCLLEEAQNHSPATPHRHFQLTCSASCNQLSDIASTIFDWLTEGIIDKATKYLYPEENQLKFLRKHNNLGELQMCNGLPSKQVLHFYNSTSKKGEEWTFDLANPSTVLRI